MFVCVSVCFSNKHLASFVYTCLSTVLASGSLSFSPGQTLVYQSTCVPAAQHCFTSVII